MRWPVRAHLAAFAAVAVPLALFASKQPSPTSAQAAPVRAALGAGPLLGDAGFGKGMFGTTPSTATGGAASTPFRLPWAPGLSMYLTQDADDDCCADHVGANKYAFDLASWDGGAFDVVAPAAGTVVHVKMSSNSGCASSSCVNEANYLVIDHGDGTQTTMLHLAQGSLDPAALCGTFVRRGQRLARTGSTGWSTGNHLHVERDQVRRNLKRVCECGADGMGCAPKQAEWNLFWPSLQQPNLPMKFQEWTAADSPSNRRGMIGPSTNLDEKEDIFTIAADTAFTASGEWTVASTGGRAGTFRHAKADGTTKGTLSLKGAGVKPGVYEVWGYVPLSTEVAAADTVVTVKGMQGVLDSSTVGGAFHPIKGLERVTLDGVEDLVFSSGAAAEGRVIVADTIVLKQALDGTLPVAKNP